MKNNKSFTLIEILVVVTIIGLITSVAAVTYSQLGKQSRDSKRKADLEQIRAAIEMYRTENNSYPSSLTMTCTAPGAISDGSNTYLSKIPIDPKCTTYQYYYAASPGGCSTNCTNYIVAAHLETVSTICQGLSSNCGTVSCTYCLDAYGEK